MRLARSLPSRSSAGVPTSTPSGQAGGAGDDSDAGLGMGQGGVDVE
ncbi:hypothetical protein HaLaN_32864, partial [Haematococcus lacustris]